MDRRTIASVRRIVVVRPNHRLGNVLLLTPLLGELERRYPLAEIELVCTGSSANAVFKTFPTISAIHTFPTRSFRHPGSVLQLIWTLSQRSFDLAIDPVTRSRAGRFVTGHVSARAKLGFRWDVPQRDRVLTDAVDPSGAPAHLGQVPLYLLGDSGERAMTDRPETAARLDMRLSSAERRIGHYRVLNAVGEQTNSPLIGFFANATGNKNYPIEWWRAVTSQLRRAVPRARFVEFVPADGVPRLASDMPNVRSPDLRILGAMIAATDRMLVADGGVMHLGVAARARVLGLFKVTDPAQYGPIGKASQALRVGDDDPGLAASVIESGFTDRGKSNVVMRWPRSPPNIIRPARSAYDPEQGDALLDL